MNSSDCTCQLIMSARCAAKMPEKVTSAATSTRRRSGSGTERLRKKMAKKDSTAMMAGVASAVILTPKAQAQTTPIHTAQAARASGVSGRPPEACSFQRAHQRCACSSVSMIQNMSCASSRMRRPSVRLRKSAMVSTLARMPPYTLPPHLRARKYMSTQVAVEKVALAARRTMKSQPSP